MTRGFYYALLAVTALGIFLRLYGIGGQPPIMDEVHVAFSADNYMESGHFGPTMENHPNMRNILVYGSMKALGTGVWGLRGFSLFLGILSIPLLGLLVFRITSNTTATALAAFFLAVDPVHITFSRQAIQEVHTAFFFLLGVLLAVAATRGDKRGRAFMLPLSGLFFGLGLASKAHAAFPLLVCLLYVFYRGEEDHDPWHEKVFAVLSLSVVPLTVYMLTYVPWFGRGYGLSDWVFMQRALFEMTVADKGSFMDIMVDTEAWQWFVKPLMGTGTFTHFEGKPFVTIAMSNPLIWMLVLPSAAYVYYRKQTEGRGMLLTLFLVAYLPLVFSPRPIWVPSSIAVTPFAYGIVGLAVSRAGQRLGKKAMAAYIAAAMVVSILLFPPAMGKAWEYGYFRPLAERFNPHEHKVLPGERKLPPVPYRAR